MSELAEQGSSVALSANGDTAIVGGLAFNSFKGAAWIYVRSGSVWSEQAKLVGGEATGFTQQGTSVALSADGNTALIGGHGEEGSGAAWVFSRVGSTWTQQAKLIGTGASGDAEQGSSVALSADGDTALVGGSKDGSGLGATWVFTRSGTTWEQQGAKLVGTGASGVVEQGTSVALSGDGNTALIGGPSTNKATGAAWVFTRTAGAWSQQEKLPAGTGSGESTGQGQSVALSGDGNTALVGGPGFDNALGAAWVYARTGSTWSQQGEKLLGEDTSTEPQVGHAVSLSEDGNTALLGGYQDDTSVGAAWAFARSGSTWGEQEKLVGTGSVGGSPTQGSSVALSADGVTALVGGAGDNGEVGAAWVFARRAPAKGSEEPPGGNEEPPRGKEQPNGNGTTVTIAPNTPSGVATTAAAIEQLALGCSGRQLVLNDVYVHHGRVAIEGAAARRFAGQKVKILFNEKRQVATAVVQSDGQYATTAPLPPAKIREALTTRYSAALGSLRSLHLKLTRRLLLEPPQASGTTVVLSGTVTPPLTKPVTPVLVEQQLECGKTTIAKRFTPPASGRFHLSLTVPTGARAAIYRLTSKVAQNVRAAKHGFNTFSLPLPVAIG